MKKRILLSLVSFFMMTTMWATLQEAFQIYVTAGANGKTGETATLTLNLKNQFGINQWTATVVLPEGVTYVDGSFATTGGRYPEGEPTLTATPNADGTVTFACALPAGTVFTGTDGAIATIDVAVASTVTPGDYKITVKDAKMVQADGTIRNYTTKESDWTIEEGAATEVGDLNGDGNIDIADAVAVLNIIAAGTNDAAADFNKDGNVDIADYISLLNIIAAL